MFTLLDWGFRSALVLPWVAIIVSALMLLVPRPERWFAQVPRGIAKRSDQMKKSPLEGLKG
jgi:hypothetical protein